MALVMGRPGAVERVLGASVGELSAEARRTRPTSFPKVLFGYSE